MLDTNTRMCENSNMSLNAIIVDGKKIAEDKKRELKDFFCKNKVKLLVIWVGNNKSSKSFISIKRRFAQGLSVEFILKHYDSVSKDELVEYIHSTSRDFDAILVQLPMEGFDKSEQQAVLNNINPHKDVDLLNEKSYEMFLNYAGDDFDKILLPPVARAVMHVLDAYNVDIENSNVVVLGKGKLVGKPVFDLLSKIAACNLLSFDKSDDKEKILNAISNADILISGIGQANFVKKEYLKDGVVLIDAGASTQKGKLQGDISLDCAEKAALFAKTPGGIGPITVAALFENLRILLDNKN